MAQKYLGLHTLDELAMQYAMIAKEGYDSQTFGGDSTEAKQARIYQQMGARFNLYDVEQAIKKAHTTLKIMAFHSEE